jgi:tryptophan 2,3-dioxygenase
MLAVADRKTSPEPGEATPVSKSPYYSDYLMLDALLDCQRPITDADEEAFFIIVHQVYELWFKQILFEIDGILEIFGADKASEERRVEERRVARAVQHLRRIARIQQVMIGQIDVLETMTPMDFLEFRDNLRPASGFQSVQFRLVETKLGVRRESRPEIARQMFESALDEADRKTLVDCEREPSLFDLIEQWLERMPFIKIEGYDFWAAYRESVERMLASRRELANDPDFSEAERAVARESVASLEESHRRLFVDPGQEGPPADRRLSESAFRAALMINLYREEPVLYQPYQLLTLLVDVDEAFASWRHRHALMAARMIGLKTGTGKSSGYGYLREAVERSKVFTDFVSLATFYLPTHYLPELPDALRRQLGFWLSPL